MTARWLECRIVDGWRYSDSHSLGGATRCFVGPGASAANGSEAQGKCARSLRLRRRRTGRGAGTALLRRRSPGKTAVEVATRTADAKSEAALPVGWPKPKTPVVSAPPAPVLALMLERPALPQAIVRTREPCSTDRMDSRDGFISLFSGMRFWPLDPNPEKILIADIAHALAHQCRFGGHASKFYSVAEHSVHISQLCLPEHALWGLLHDASEA